jgi:flagellar P-ring protein precursor FlgI
MSRLLKLITCTWVFMCLVMLVARADGSENDLPSSQQAEFPRAAAMLAGDGMQVRIKDVATFRNLGTHQLVGYGLVIGLNGSGDSRRSAPFTAQSVKSMLDRLGVSVTAGALQAQNVAAVIVTAELPVSATLGSRLDVTVSSLGDAKSLAGGTLVLTPLTGSDGEVFAVAQGAVTVGGFQANGESEELVAGIPTAGRVANGALVQRSPSDTLNSNDFITLQLNNPDFSLSVQVADQINRFARAIYKTDAAREKNERLVLLRKPKSVSFSRFLAQIGNLSVRADEPAAVVVDERSGTIVIGKNVKVSTVAVTHGNLTVRVTEENRVSQPQPFSDGQTVVSTDTLLQVDQPPGQLEIVSGASLQNLVFGLNQMGLKPKGIIAILQAIKSAGALHANLVVQ